MKRHAAAVLFGLSVATTLIATDYRVMGVIQVKFLYHHGKDPSNEFLPGKTSLGIDGDIAKGFGYRLLISLGKDFKYSAFDIYGRYRFRYGEIRFGQFKPPFSMERLISFPKRDFIDNAIITGIVPARDMGVGFFGNFTFAELNLALINGEGLNAVEINSMKDIILRIVSKYKFLRIGGAIYYGKSGPTDSIKPKNRYNLQAEIKTPKICVRGELLLTQDDNTHGMGYYLQAGMRFGQFEPVVRYEFYDPGTGIQSDVKLRTAIGMNYYLKGYKLRLQVNYVIDRTRANENSHTIKGLFQLMW